MSSLIGISGKIGSGKDTLARLLQIHDFNARGWRVEKDHIITFLQRKDDEFFKAIDEHYSVIWKQKMFAEHLKVFVANILNIPLNQLSDQAFKKSNLPAEWDVFKHYTSFADGKRSMTVRELLIAIGDGMRERVHPDIWVIARFSAFQSTDNWILPDLRYPNEKAKIESLGGINIRIERPGIPVIDHISETGLDNAQFDFKIQNDRDLSYLYDQSKELYDTITERFASIVAPK